jgi:DNA modification methylase
MIRRGDLVLDQFAGGGTTFVEAKLLNRDIIGVDVNDVALERCKEKTDFEHEGANGKVYLRKGMHAIRVSSTMKALI